MSLLLVYLFIALGFSFLCSMLESVLLSTTLGFIGAYEKKHPRTGRRMRQFKTDIDRPLSAILSLNTIAHTFGATGVGAQALAVFGHEFVAVISAVLTLLILVVSEIIPKTFGALYWRELAPVATLLLRWMIIALYPLVWLSKILTQVMARGKTVRSINREEFQAMADIGYREGQFRKDESRIIRNLFRLRQLTASDVMTPRTVMFILPSEMSVCDVVTRFPLIRFSRIPIYEEDSPTMTHFVLKSDIYLEASRGNDCKAISELRRPLSGVPETAPLIRLFDRFVKQREHAMVVVDEHGSITGMVTMEDVLETLLGIEIMDETDTVADMRALARKQWRRRVAALGVTLEPADTDPE